MKELKTIKGSGGGGDQTPHIPVEGNDTLSSTSYIRIVDLIAEGEIVGLVNADKSIFLDQTRLQNLDGTYNFTGVTYEGRTGTQDQTYLSGFSLVENEVSISTELKNNGGSPTTGAVTRQITNPAISRIKARITFPSLTSTDPSSGDISGATCGVSIWLQPSGGSFTQVASRVVSGKSSSRFEVSLQFELTGTGPWTMRVQRDTADPATTYLQNKSFLESYTEVIDAKLRYPNSALIGMRLDAQQFSNVPARYFEVD